MANIAVEDVSSIVANIYEAAYDQERWLHVVAALREMLDGSRCCIVRISEHADAISTVHDPELNSSEATAVYRRDPLGAKAFEVPIGTVGDYERLAGKAAWRRSEIWQDWFRPRDMDQGLLCNLFASVDGYWMIDVHRASWQNPFSADQIELFQKLAPHLLRAGQISRRLENVSALASAFSHLPFGIFVVNGHCKVLQMNEAAEAMLARPDSPLELKEREIAIPDPGDMLCLQQLVINACSSNDGVTPGTGGTIMVPSHRKPSNLARLVLSVAPFYDTQAYGLAAERRAVIMISEATPQIHDGYEAHVRNLFDLTPAEARLAAGLISGHSIKETATRANITVKTGRTYLERIFAKTGTRQQSELVALLKSTEPLRRR